jgi:hypothetical protein
MPKCPKCHGQGECDHLGLLEGADSMYDGYQFVCNKCGYTEHASVYADSASWNDWPTKCPYCEELDVHDEYHTIRQEGLHPFPSPDWKGKHR